MNISIPNFIKRMIAIDGIWGARTKKASGIQDRFSTITEVIVFTASANTITFTTAAPSWMTTDGLNGKAIRVMNAIPHPNAGKKFYISAVLAPNQVQVTPATPADTMVDSNELTKISGRIWEVVQNENICGSDREGNSIYNVHHQEKGANDGGDVSLVHFDHYHGRIVVGDHNSAGWPQVEIQYAPIPDGMGGFVMSQVTGPVRAEVVTAIDGRVVKS